MATYSGALAPDLYTCSFPGCPAPVIIDISLVETLQRIVRDTGEDQQGIIFGQKSAAGTFVRSSSAVQAFEMEAMRQAIADAQGLVVGFYRIREGKYLELTTGEMNLAATFFSGPGSAILLIVRREKCAEANFFYQTQGSYLNLPLLEFPLDSAELSQREAKRLKKSDVAVVVPAAKSLTPPRSSSSAPARVEKPKPAAARWQMPNVPAFPIIVLLAVLALSTALFLFWPHNRTASEVAPRSTPAPEAGTSLRAEWQGKDLKIMWDLHSAAVASATAGVLNIDDGGTTRQIPLTADQVRFGSLLYSPLAEQISVRFTTLKDQQSTAQASLLLIRPQQPQLVSAADSNKTAVNSRQTPKVKAPVSAPQTANVKAPVSPPKATVPAPQTASVKAPVSTPQNASVKVPVSTPKSPVSAPQNASIKPVTTTRQTPGIPLEVKTERQASPRPFTPPAGKREVRPPVELGDLPASQASPQRFDLPASLRPGSVSPPPAVVAPSLSEPAPPPQEQYVAPVLISQGGMRTPRELLPVLTRPLTVSVRVEVNELGRVTHAEAIAEKGIHALLLTAATDAARRCRFQPARRGQSPVSSSVTVVYHVGPEQK